MQIRHETVRQPVRLHLYRSVDEALPKIAFEVNWSNLDCLTNVRSQGACKAPGIYAALSAIEAHNCIISGLKRSFSLQQIIDCGAKEQGCIAKPSSTAFNYIQRQGGLSVDSLYPMRKVTKATDPLFGSCKFSISKSGVQVNGGSKDIKPFDEAALIAALL